MSHVGCPLCGLSVLQGRFPLEGPVDGVSLLEFRGLGRGKGFEVKARRSALDDSILGERIARRATEILLFLKAGVPGRTSGAEAELEVLRADLSETERVNRGLKQRLAAETGQRRGRDRELEVLRADLSETERVNRGLKQRLAAETGQTKDQNREIKQLRQAATQAERMFSSLESSVRSLLASLRPLLDKCEYVAMDDPRFADDYQDAVDRVASVRSVLSEDFD